MFLILAAMNRAGAAAEATEAEELSNACNSSFFIWAA